jgi:PhnB protein
MAAKIDPIPVGPRAITAYLTIKGAAKGIEFYKQAFGAKELICWTGKDGRVGHAEIEINGTPVFLSDEHPEMGVVSPVTLGGTCVGLRLLVEDADATFKRAVAAGGTAVRPMEDEPWGQKSGTLQDPFGHRWFVTQRTADLSLEEMDKIGKAAGYKTLT